ncbi:hypothetical protein PT974_10349 [Cladobotryum mycophilum]|uniref:Uncharacterized protein n=1 Tax=Cladobotryum mycophilum TaxID=491253 RepID=A0ABR0S9L7_9HYPO
MTEMEMEVDMAPPFGFDGHAGDEDLIDYDIDTAEQHHQQTFPTSHEEESHPDSSLPDAQTDVSMGLDTKFSDPTNEGNDHQDIEEGDLQDDAHMDGEAVADEDMTTEQKPSEDGYVNNVDVFDGPAKDIADAAEAAVIETRDVENEINYEEYEIDGGNTAEEESYDQHQGHEDTANEPESKNEQDVAENAPATTPTRPSGEHPEGAQDANADADATKSVAEVEEDEITWEQEEDRNADSPTQDAAVSQIDTGIEDEAAPENEGVDFEARPESEEAQNDEPEGLSQDEQDDDVDVNHDENVTVEPEDVGSVAGLETSQAHSPADDESFPAITVQYKGDEFPFFSLETSAGFFSSLSALDDSMESLLAGLRSELSNEIAAEDELVFQVDELGLEFAESHLRDSLSSITLRQILEIFDLLVKNQDPDSTRTLYTYLFTRPSTSKRFEFLIESAAAGKGLDEVIHLFESPMPQNTAVVDAAQTAESMDENLNNYESSPVENADANDEESSQREINEEQEEDENQDETLTDQVEYEVDDDEDLADDGYVHVEEETEEHVEEYIEEQIEEQVEENIEEQVEEHAEEDVEEQVEDIEEQPQHDIPAADGVVDSDQQAISDVFDEPTNIADTNGKTTNLYTYLEHTFSSKHTNFHHLRNISDFSTTFSMTDADEVLPDHLESDSNPFIHNRMDELEDANADDIEQEESHSADEQSEDENNNLSTANTATTHTLADDGDAISNLAETNTDHVLDHETTGEEVLIDDDELAEIDWRDETDLADAAGHDTLAITTKRARPIDETSMEEEQDVKRRRS